MLAWAFRPSRCLSFVHIPCFPVLPLNLYCPRTFWFLHSGFIWYKRFCLGISRVLRHFPLWHAKNPTIKPTWLCTLADPRSHNHHHLNSSRRPSTVRVARQGPINSADVERPARLVPASITTTHRTRWRGGGRGTGHRLGRPAHVQQIRIRSTSRSVLHSAAQIP